MTGRGQVRPGAERGAAVYEGREPFRLVTLPWSDTPMKGYDVRGRIQARLEQVGAE